MRICFEIIYYVCMALGWCAMIHDFDTLGSESNYHLWSGSLPHNCIPVHCRPQTRGDERCLGRGAIEWCQHRHAWGNELQVHYSDVIMSAMTSQITGVSMVCSTVCSGADWGKHQSSALLAFVTGFHRWPMNSPHKGPVTRKMFPFDDVIMWGKIEIVDLMIKHIPSADIEIGGFMPKCK